VSAGFSPAVNTIKILRTRLAGRFRPMRNSSIFPAKYQEYSDRAADENRTAIEELVSKLLSFATVQKELQNLLRGSVSMRGAVRAIETRAGACGHD
jgi:flagellar biosynthesis component FlhA